MAPETIRDASTASQAFKSALEVVGAVAPEVAAAIRSELEDQRHALKLIASENYSSPAVQLAMGVVPLGPADSKWPRGQQAMSEVRRCLRTHAGHQGNREADSRRLRAWRALHRQNRYAKPMELPPNLTAVYLGEFKRALAWASCRRPTREFWQ